MRKEGVWLKKRREVQKNKVLIRQGKMSRSGRHQSKGISVSMTTVDRGHSTTSEQRTS